MRLIILNMFLGAVIDGYSEIRNENDSLIKPQHIEEFIEKWSIYDEKASEFITPESFIFLMYELSKPFGFRDDKAIKQEIDYGTLNSLPFHLELIFVMNTHNSTCWS
jgi:hypothetical protein